MSEENNSWEQFFKNASPAEKVAAILIIFSFFAGTFGLTGDFAIVGVIMAGLGTIIGLIKKNWALVVMGAIDVYYLLEYMNDIAEINDIMNSYPY
jgi:hypothetical protein